MLSNYIDEIAYLGQIIDRVFSMSRMSTIEEIHQFLVNFKIKG